MAPEPASSRAANSAPITAGPVPAPRNKAPWNMPNPAPTCSPESALAAALMAGEWAKANPAPTPRIPAETSTGDAELDRRVRSGEEADREWLRRERGVVAAQLELVLVGSLGFWVTIGLLAGWSLVLPPRKHGEPAA